MLNKSKSFPREPSINFVLCQATEKEGLCFANTENISGPRTLSYQPPEWQINKKKKVIYMWSPENNTNERICKIETDS